MSRETACTGKVRYETVGQALKARQQHSRRMIYYHCPFCEGLHLSSRARSHQQRREDKIQAVIAKLRAERATRDAAANGGGKK